MNARNSNHSSFYLSANSTRDGEFEVVVDPKTTENWQYTGFRVLDLAAGGEQQLDTADTEIMVVPLTARAA